MKGFVVQVGFLGLQPDLLLQLGRESPEVRVQFEAVHEEGEGDVVDVLAHLPDQLDAVVHLRVGVEDVEEQLGGLAVLLLGEALRDLLGGTLGRLLTL